MYFRYIIQGKMKKQGKRFMAVVLSITMLLTLVLPASATENEAMNTNSEASNSVYGTGVSIVPEEISSEGWYARFETIEKTVAFYQRFIRSC